MDSREKEVFKIITWKTKKIAMHNSTFSRLYLDTFGEEGFTGIFNSLNGKPSLLREHRLGRLHIMSHGSRTTHGMSVEKPVETLKEKNPLSHCRSANFTADSTVKLSLSERQQTGRRQFTDHLPVHVRTRLLKQWKLRTGSGINKQASERASEQTNKQTRAPLRLVLARRASDVHRTRE